MEDSQLTLFPERLRDTARKYATIEDFWNETHKSLLIKEEHEKLVSVLHKQKWTVEDKRYLEDKSIIGKSATFYNIETKDDFDYAQESKDLGLLRGQHAEMVQEKRERVKKELEAQKNNPVPSPQKEEASDVPVDPNKEEGGNEGAQTPNVEGNPQGKGKLDFQLPETLKAKVTEYIGQGYTDAEAEVLVKQEYLNNQEASNVTETSIAGNTPANTKDEFGEIGVFL